MRWADDSNERLAKARATSWSNPSMNFQRAFSAFSMSQRIGSLLGGLAVLSALLSVVPPVISNARELFSLGYVQHDVIRAIRDTFYASLVLATFLWLHFAWKRAALRWAVRAMAAICMAVGLLVGVIVWEEAPQFWIVWPTYGQDIQFGLALWAVTSCHPVSKLIVGAVVVTTGGLVLLLPESMSTSATGFSAILSFFVFLWLLGSLLPVQERLARALRGSLIVCLTYYSLMPLATLVRLSLAAIVLTELRTLVTPPTDCIRAA